mgnify:CR=1 FL=1
MKLKFRYETELFNHTLKSVTTSKYFSMPLLSPTALKEKILNYFNLYGIDISFILPYN